MLMGMLSKDIIYNCAIKTVCNLSERKGVVRVESCVSSLRIIYYSCVAQPENPTSAPMIP
jgi:hypothetical protein